MQEIIERIVKILVIKKANPVISFQFFMDQITAYYEANKDSLEARSLDDFKALAVLALKKMASEKECGINYEGDRITYFHVHKYYRQLTMEYYKKMESHPEISFPDTYSFNFKIDSNWIISFSIMGNIDEAYSIMKENSGKVLVLTFEDGISDIILPLEIFETIFFDIILKKVHLFVQDQINYTYLSLYLKKAIEGNEIAVKSLMESMLKSPDTFKEYVKKPSDFSFKFFSFMCNKILKDLASKNEKTVAGICMHQAILMLRFFVTRERAVVQHKSQKRNDLKDLSQKVQKAPYIFSISQIYEITDITGKTYREKYSKNFIIDFIKDAITRKEGDDLPFLVKFIGENKKEYYIYRNMIPQVFLRLLVDTSKEIRGKFINEWTDLMRNFKKNKEMQSNAMFVEALNYIIESDYKLLNAMLKPWILYFANRLENVNKDIKMSIASCFDDKVAGKFKSMDILLGLKRQELIQQVKFSLPIQYNMPILGKLIALFIGKGKNVSAPKKKEKKIAKRKDESSFQEIGSSSDENNKEKRRASQEFQKAVVNLKKKYLHDGQTIDESLDELMDQWNPLLNKLDRAALEEDVNSLIRDFIRKKKAFFIKNPPDEKRFANLAEDLLRKTSSIGINKKESFGKYIELYIIKLFENIKKL